MSSRRKNGLTPMFAIMFVAYGGLIATLVSGNSPNLGLDLQGGVSVVLQPLIDGKRTTNVSAEALDQTKQVIEKRVNAIGVGEPEITVQGSNIVVQLPGIKDQQRALDLVGKTAELRFRPVLGMAGTKPTKADEERVAQLRSELKVPDGVSALDVYNAERTARGEQPIPDPNAPTTTTPPSGEVTPADSSTSATPTSAVAPTTAVASTTAAGGPGRSAGTHRSRAQDGPTTPATDPTAVTDPSAAPTTTTPPTTTTTIDPTPKNQYGITVFSNPEGELEGRLSELLGLENSASAAAKVTAPGDDKADQEVILPGQEEVGKDGVARVPLYRLGPALLTGKAVETASAGLSQQGKWEVRPTFREGPEGIDLFNAAAAKCYAGDPVCPVLGQGQKQGQMAIVLDSLVLTAPSIDSPSFSRDQIQISGSFKEKDAKDVATALRYGALPLTLETQQVQTVSATLGKGALRAGLIAGAVGLALVALYMVLYYRILGLVTVAALTVSASLLWTIIAFFGEHYGLTLTLSGIVGIVVSIGVSLDSSVVYYENLKEDVRNGRTLRSAVDRSFSSAYSTILKADVSSLLGALILYWLSIGPVRGFAFYLALSTLLDLISSYFFTRPLVGWLGRTNLADRPQLFGIPVDAPSVEPVPEAPA